MNDELLGSMRSLLIVLSDEQAISYGAKYWCTVVANSIQDELNGRQLERERAEQPIKVLSTEVRRMGEDYVDGLLGKAQP